MVFLEDGHKSRKSVVQNAGDTHVSEEEDGHGEDQNGEGLRGVQGAPQVSVVVYDYCKRRPVSTSMACRHRRVLVYVRNVFACRGRRADGIISPVQVQWAR